MSKVRVKIASGVEFDVDSRIQARWPDDYPLVKSGSKTATAGKKPSGGKDKENA
jgi:hypothetical protein